MMLIKKKIIRGELHKARNTEFTSGRKDDLSPLHINDMEVSPLRRPHPGERREMVDDIDFAEAFGDGSWIQHRTFDVLCARLEIFRRPSIEDAHRVAAGNERRPKV